MAQLGKMAQPVFVPVLTMAITTLYAVQHAKRFIHVSNSHQSNFTNEEAKAVS